MLDLVPGGPVKAKINGSSPYAFLKCGAITITVLAMSEPKNHKLQIHCFSMCCLD